jgi:hypothetical protein
MTKAERETSLLPEQRLKLRGEFLLPLKNLKILERTKDEWNFILVMR